MRTRWRTSSAAPPAGLCSTVVVEWKDFLSFTSTSLVSSQTEGASTIEENGSWERGSVSGRRNHTYTMLHFEMRSSWCEYSMWSFGGNNIFRCRNGGRMRTKFLVPSNRWRLSAIPSINSHAPINRQRDLLTSFGDFSAFQVHAIKNTTAW